MGTRISSEKMVSNTERRIADAPINAQMPRMLFHIRSRYKTIRDNESAACTKCDAEVDVEEDEAVAR